MAADTNKRRCANCGAAPPADAVACPICGSPLPTPEVRLAEDLDAVADQALVKELEALSREAKAEVEAADKTLGRLRAVEEEAQVVEKRPEEERAEPVRGEPPPAAPRPMEPPREEPKEADLSAFVARVEQAVAASARQPQPPPAPSRAGAALIAVGALVAVTGMFLLPAAILWGAFTFLGGIAALSLGAVVRYGRRQ